MIRQSSTAGPCKYLHNYYKKSNIKFLQNKEKKKRKLLFFQSFTEFHIMSEEHPKLPRK